MNAKTCRSAPAVRWQTTIRLPEGGRKDVLPANQATVEERRSRRHQHDESRRAQDPRGVAATDHDRLAAAFRIGPDAWPIDMASVGEPWRSIPIGGMEGWFSSGGAKVALQRRERRRQVLDRVLECRNRHGTPRPPRPPRRVDPSAPSSLTVVGCGDARRLERRHRGPSPMRGPHPGLHSRRLDRRLWRADRLTARGPRPAAIPNVSGAEIDRHRAGA